MRIFLEPFRRRLTALMTATTLWWAPNLAIAEPIAEGPVEGPTPAPATPIPPRGVGLMIAGGVITGVVAVPLLAVGAVNLASTRGNDTDAVGLTIGAIALGAAFAVLAGGVTMLAIGGVRNGKYRAWKRVHALKLAPTGVALRF